MSGWGLPLGTWGISLPSRLGVWQFLADMPYGSVSLATTWKIFWNIYCKQACGGGGIPGPRGGAGGSEVVCGGAGPVLLSPDASPTSIEEIQEALKGWSWGWRWSKFPRELGPLQRFSGRLFKKS